MLYFINLQIDWNEHMDILLVDDDIDVIAGIIAGVNFKDIGIDKVHTATSAVQAKEILALETVDILLTDIEMPGESGLDLLAWVRSNAYDIVTLFCTSYADFNYAKKAVEMHSFDYFLKPISYKSLQERLSAAVSEVEKNRESFRYKKGNKLWLHFQNESRKYFWTHALFSSKPIGQLLFESANPEIVYNRDDNFCIAQIILYDTNTSLEEWKNYGFRNMAEEIITETGLIPEAMIPANENSWTLVYAVNEDYNDQLFLLTLQKLRECANNYLEAELNAYYIPDISCSKTKSVYKQIKDFVFDDVSSRNNIIRVDKVENNIIKYSPTDMQKWELLLLAGKGEELIAALNGFIDCHLKQGHIDRSFLMAMRMSVAQMLYSHLNQMGINVQDLFLTEKYKELIGASLLSIINFKRFLKYEVELAVKQISFSQESTSIIGQAKEYIKNHLSEEVNRTTMAKQFFLNPDYLARMFKKETGQSIGAYLQDRRLHEAKKLLLNSNTQVNEIALIVGYDNFSYFSHVFKSKTGMTPNEFRKQNSL